MPSPRTAVSRAPLTRALSLNRRTGHRAIGTEHTAIARFWPQLRAAPTAFVKELTGIGRHAFRFCRAAMRASDERFKDHGVFLKHVADVGGSSGIGEHCRFQVVDGEIVADREAKKVDHLVGMRPDKMRSQNPAAVL